MVRINKLSEEESAWTFGQILALFVLLGVVVEVINILLPKLDTPSHVRTSEDVDTNVNDTMVLAVSNPHGRSLEQGSIA